MSETPERSMLKTYAQWAAAGRQVRAGQRAQWYATDEERSASVALFHVDQTDEFHEPDLSGLNVLVPREEIKQPKEKGKPKIRVAPIGTGLAVWCGSNAAALKILKKAGWYFDRAINRWCHADRELARFKAAMEAEGFEVIVDG